MNRRAVILFVVLIVIFLVFRFCNNKPAPQPQEKEVPLSVTENSSVFNQSFNTLLSAYYQLKDALVASDTIKVNAAAHNLAMAASALKTGEIQGDASGTIKETAGLFAGTVRTSAEALSAERTIDAKRKEFEMITDGLYSLTRTVKFDGQKIYYQYCPMAFNNKGAYWLSDTREIRNPYFGDKMLTCGQVADSLDYSKR